MSLLTLIICVPLLTALVILVTPGNYKWGIRMISIASAFIMLALGFQLFFEFDSAPVVDGYRFVQQVPWIGSLGISYHVGVDGINLGLVVMGCIVAFAAICCSWEITTRVKEYYLLLMVMIAGILGAFASLDLFFFYVFHEFALIPTFLMIGFWGRGAEKNYATFKITLYLSLGALIALIGLISLYVQTGAQTFDIVDLIKAVKVKPISSAAQEIIFPMLLFGFGILVSLWPFHTWAPIGYASAPTATAMLHAGVLKKFGLYGLIRIALPLLPEGAQSWMTIVAFLCLGNILLCGLVAIRQKDLNYLIGNSSVAHMGFIFLGIASLNLIGVTGAVMVMVAHGLLAALTFGLSGYLYNKAETLQMDQMGGLLQRLPFVGAALVMALLAGCGLPGFANFAGEILVLFGAWSDLTCVAVVAAWGGLVIGGVYMLRAIRNVLHGPLPEKFAAIPDGGFLDKITFSVLLAALLALGCWPRLLTDKIQPSADTIVKLANGLPEKTIRHIQNTPTPGRIRPGIRTPRAKQ